jgi:hypothetical protein
LLARGAGEDESGYGGYVRLDGGPKFGLGAGVRVIAGGFVENPAWFDGLADRDPIVTLPDMLEGKVCVSIEAGMVAAA